MTNATEAQPSNTDINEASAKIRVRCVAATDLNEICYVDGFDATAALDALDKVVDGIVRQEAWGELQAGHDALKQTSHAHLFPAASTYHADQMSTAGEEFNRIECENLRGVLARLVNHFVDTDSITELRLLARYLLNRKVGAGARCAGDYDLGAEAEGAAEAQLRGLKAANR
jgi:hypothetical protein